MSRGRETVVDKGAGQGGGASGWAFPTKVPLPDGITFLELTASHFLSRGDGGGRKLFCGFLSTRPIFRLLGRGVIRKMIFSVRRNASTNVSVVMDCFPESKQSDRGAKIVYLYILSAELQGSSTEWIYACTFGYFRHAHIQGWANPSHHRISHPRDLWDRTCGICETSGTNGTLINLKKLYF